MWVGNEKFWWKTSGDVEEMKTSVLFTYNYSKGSNVTLPTLIHTYLAVSSKVLVNHFQNSRYLTMRHQLIRITTTLQVFHSVVAGSVCEILGICLKST